MRLTPLTIVAIAGALATPAALAQYGERSGSQERQERERQTQKDQKEKQWLSAEHRFQKGSDILGKDVRNRQDEDLGEIEDLVISQDDGQIVYAAVSYGGVLGMGDKLFAAPWRSLRLDPQNDRFLLNVSADRLEDAPGFESDKWPDPNDEAWVVEVHEFWGQWPESGTYRYRVYADDPEERGQQGKTTLTGSLRASKIMGMDVKNTAGEELGEIEDIRIDVHRGVATHVVLQRGGVLGIGADLYAIPWTDVAVRGPADDQYVFLPLDKDKLQQARTFQGDEWPGDPSWFERNDRLFGVEQHARREGRTGFGDETYGSTADREWMAGSQYNRKYDARAATTIHGPVTKVEQVAPMDGMSDAVVIHVRTQGDKTMKVHVAPVWFMRHQDRQIDEGARVRVIGSQTTLDNEACILARMIEFDGRTLVLRTEDGHPYWDAWQEGAKKEAAATGREAGGR